MKHEWKLGWKEIRGVYVDVCRICGAGHVISSVTAYIPPCDVRKFLTTSQPVTFEKYIPCTGGK